MILYATDSTGEKYVAVELETLPKDDTASILVEVLRDNDILEPVTITEIV